MKAIILAAGIGSRLRPITDGKPKTLVKINDYPILYYILNSLKSNGIKDVVICTGYKSTDIKNYCDTIFSSLNINYVENKDYEITNNMYSLYLASEFLTEDIVLMNADLVYDSEIIKGIIAEPCSAVAVDKGRYREESMKVTLSKKGYVNGISKTIVKGNSYGCSIDIYKIKKNDLILIKNEMTKIISDRKDRNSWTEVMLNNLFQSESLLAKPYCIGSARWVEIDNFDDLSQAEVLFNKKIRLLKNKKIFFVDRDGTLTLANKKIEGVDILLNKLKSDNKKFYVLTNNSSRTPDQHYEAFKKLGLDIGKQNILLSTDVAINFLKENSLKNIFWVANENVSLYLQKNGFNFDDSKPSAVLLTYDDEITYQKLKKMCALIREGVPYFTTHSDVVCPTSEGFIPDIGTFIELVRLTTGKCPNIIFGKPHREFIDSILETKKLTYNDAVIIGDRLYTDIKLAENSSITSILTLTGETSRAAYEDSDTRADIVVKNLTDLIEYL